MDEIVNTVRLLAVSFGGINLEDISAPRCFEIERKLRECCDIPVFHDDQHGTAVVTAAAVINAVRLTGRNMAGMKTVPVSYTHLDREREKSKRRAMWRSIGRIAAIFLVCITVAGGIGMGTSEAFRTRVFEFFSSDEESYAGFRSNTEEDMLAGWSDYWYPEYMPDGFIMTYACLLYTSRCV